MLLTDQDWESVYKILKKRSGLLSSFFSEPSEEDKKLCLQALIEDRKRFYSIRTLVVEEAVASIREERRVEICQKGSLFKRV